MSNLIFIYHKKFKQLKLLSLVFFTITLITLIYISIIGKNDLIPTFFSLLIVSGIGFYLSYLSQLQTLSFTINKTHIAHHSLKGGWKLPWNKIANIDVPYLEQSGIQKKLPWAAIRLKNIEPLLNSISLRLANQLLLEQQNLLLIATRYQPNSKHDLDTILFDDKSYIASSGKIYRGLLAMLANRMKYTREIYGFDLFIHENNFNIPLEDFIGLSRPFLAANFNQE